MKEFWKMFLAAVCGFLIASIITYFIIFILIGGAISSALGAKKINIPDSAVLAIDMSEFTVAEQEMATGDLLSIIQGGRVLPPISLYKAVTAIEMAASDPAIKYIYLKTDGSTSSIASIAELREALADFRKSGKSVIAYTEQVSTGSYYLASVADKVYTTEYQGASTAFTGLCAQSFYLKDLLDRFGVNMQLIRHGKYKSAGEMFVRNSPSDENKEQYQRLVDSMWESIAGEIAKSRGISMEDLDRMVNGLELCLPEDFLDKGLVDGVLTRDELKGKLATFAYADSFEDTKFISLMDYATVRVKKDFRKKGSIAIIYADGEIIDDNYIDQINGDRFTAIIDEIRNDEDIKAVVLRVNSPGGAVLSSEKIKHELDLLGEEKPLIASYGDYAASGGYWISNNCSRIFSDAVTLTGSIGVFGLVPDVSGTIKDIAHVGVYSAKSHEHSDMMNMTRPFDKTEYSYMERSIETIYDKFTTTVAEGRGLDKARVDEIGQGRVWTGADALELGLVDEIGGLRDALAYAAECAGNADVAEWKISEYPRELSSIEMLRYQLGEKPEGYKYVLSKFKEMSVPTVLARMPYQITVL